MNVLFLRTIDDPNLGNIIITTNILAATTYSGFSNIGVQVIRANETATITNKKPLNERLFVLSFIVIRRNYLVSFSRKIVLDIPSVWSRYTTTQPIAEKSFSYWSHASVPFQSEPTNTTSAPNSFTGRIFSMSS